MTDTQPTAMVGCYSGNPGVGTPNLDRLAAQGIRFNRAYTTSPLCTPARSALFSGMHAPVNGAWANSMAPGTNFPLIGTIFRELGYRCAYTGKWHLDGTSYFGDGKADGGFEQQWWFDGRNYADFLGPDAFEKYYNCRTSADLRAGGFELGKIWGHQVANRAIDFLEQKHDRPFLLAASFDEPHGPFVAPAEYWENYDIGNIPIPKNLSAPLSGKPALQSRLRHEFAGETPESYREAHRKHYACNQYIDTEIGRLLEAVERLHGGNTILIYTSDHGDMLHAHGLTGKGPMMYEEVLRIPLIVRYPGGPENRRCDALVSHLDILPTLLQIAGHTVPGILQGHSFLDQLKHPETGSGRQLLASFTRFGLNHDGWGGFCPIRCLITAEYKLVVNLLDTDELYHRESDPLEMRNLIDDLGHAQMRDCLHDMLLEEMDRIRDPFRTEAWSRRSWRPDAKRPIRRRPRPSVFPFQPACIEADGVWSKPVA